MTQKESLNDLDLLLVMAADFELVQLPEDWRVLFDYTQARIRFTADVFWTRISQGIFTQKEKGG